jgi:hypothetical protein
MRQTLERESSQVENRQWQIVFRHASEIAKSTGFTIGRANGSVGMVSAKRLKSILIVPFTPIGLLRESPGSPL